MTANEDRLLTLKARLGGIVDLIPNKSRCASFDYPVYANIGEPLIFLGMAGHLADHGLKLLYAGDF